MRKSELIENLIDRFDSVPIKCRAVSKGHY